MSHTSTHRIHLENLVKYTFNTHQHKDNQEDINRKNIQKELRITKYSPINGYK